VDPRYEGHPRLRRQRARPSSGPPPHPRPVGCSGHASGNFSPDQIGCQDGSRRTRRRAGWAMASANGFSFAPPIAPSVCSAAPASRRRAPRTHHFQRDLRLDPSVGERHRLRAPPHVR
jgi:hypothetical protein